MKTDYTFVVDFTDIIAAAVGESKKTVRIDAGEVFVITSMNVEFFTSAGNAYIRSPSGATVSQHVGNVMMQVFVSGKPWSNNPVRASAYAGTAESPGYKIQPQVIKAGEDIQVVLRNLAPSSDLVGQVIFNGYKATGEHARQVLADAA